MHAQVTEMKVDGIYSKALTATSRRKIVQGADGFADMLSDAIEDNTDIPVIATPHAPDLDLLLGLQAIMPEPNKQSTPEQVRAYGKELLASLQKLQQNMLLPGATTAQAEEVIESLLAEYPAELAEDPELTAAIQALRLRAMVELAKRG